MVSCDAAQIAICACAKPIHTYIRAVVSHTTLEGAVAGEHMCLGFSQQNNSIMASDLNNFLDDLASFQGRRHDF